MNRRRTVKQNNRKIILDLARRADGFSIADIADRSGISKTTVNKVLDFYIDQGLVLEAGKGGSSDEGGKRPALFQFNRNYGYIASLHVGPGFIKGILTNMEGEILHSVHKGQPELQVDEIAGQLAVLIGEFNNRAIEGAVPLIAVVLAVAGVVDPDTGISVYSPHYDSWGNDVPLLDMVRNGLDFEVPFYMDNVNRFQAFAEKAIGCAEHVSNFLILDAIDEGVGAGVVLNGTLRHGVHNLSGEIGHMVLLPRGGDDCICGGKGCFEAMVSRKRIERLVSEGRSRFPDSAVFSEAGSFELDHLFRAARGQDPLAREILEDIASWFALGLNNIIMVNDPHLVVIQGIYTDAGDWFLERIKEEINRLSYPDIDRSLDIVYSELGPDRGVLGGAAYAIWDFFETTDIYGRVS
jgi:predicted NBD/HSP70 family sugar kinase